MLHCFGQLTCRANGWVPEFSQLATANQKRNQSGGGITTLEVSEQGLEGITVTGQLGAWGAKDHPWEPDFELSCV